MLVDKLVELIRPLKRVLFANPAILARGRAMRQALWRAEVRWRANHRGRALDIERTVMMDPRRIEWRMVAERIDRYGDAGQVIAGDWDLNRQPFRALDVYSSFLEHFSEGVQWEETEYYQRVLSEIEAGVIKFDCASREDLDRRCVGLDALYQDIEENGYRSQAEIHQRADRTDPFAGLDEISVRVARDGALLFEDGRHRLAIAQILGVPQVPIRIAARHTTWQAFVEEITAHGARQPTGTIYQPLTHPDLADIPADYDDERFEMMRGAIPPGTAGGASDSPSGATETASAVGEDYDESRGRLLDIGANWGYFCHRFEAIGYDCVAYEIDASSQYFLRRLRDAENRRFEIVPDSILETTGPLRFDVVVALNIFHHFLKTESAFEKLVDLLGRLDVDQMFFQSHQRGSPQMAGAYRDMVYEDFVDFILDATSLTSAEEIGRMADGRRLYSLTR